MVNWAKFLESISKKKVQEKKVVWSKSNWIRGKSAELLFLGKKWQMVACKPWMEKRKYKKNVDRVIKKVGRINIHLQNHCQYMWWWVNQCDDETDVYKEKYNCCLYETFRDASHVFGLTPQEVRYLKVKMLTYFFADISSTSWKNSLIPLAQPSAYINIHIRYEHQPNTEE